MKTILTGTYASFDTSKPFELFYSVEGNGDWYRLDNGAFIESNGDGSYTSREEENGRVYEEHYQELQLVKLDEDGDLEYVLSTLGFVSCGR